MEGAFNKKVEEEGGEYTAESKTLLKVLVWVLNFKMFKLVYLNQTYITFVVNSN